MEKGTVCMSVCVCVLTSAGRERRGRLDKGEQRLRVRGRGVTRGCDA